MLIEWLKVSAGRADMLCPDVLCSQPNRAEAVMAFSRLIAGFVCFSAVLVPAYAAEESHTPDLSGVWGRNTLEYGQPVSGPGPIKNIGIRLTAGDYKNPILKPWAAEIVEKMGNISRTGDAFPTAHNQC